MKLLGRVKYVRAPTRYIDVHCHLENEEFDDDRTSVVETASRMGICIITSSIQSETWNKGLQIASSNHSVYLSVGLDPTEFKDIDLLIEWGNTHPGSFIAIGEVGLDHFRIRDHTLRDEQKKAFEKAIELAENLRLPIQVHSRSAGKKALEVLRTYDISNVHMHAFDGKASFARTASNEYGYYFSIPTSVIRSPQKRKLVKAVDIERLLIETDSPVLGPERGERNEPSNVLIVLQEISNILCRDKEEIREIILENTLRLYKGIT